MRKKYINMKEIMAIILALKTFSQIWEKEVLQILTDNTVVMWYIKKVGMSPLIHTVQTGASIGGHPKGRHDYHRSLHLFPRKCFSREDEQITNRPP